jgi:PAS domain S-box-containing protein
MDQSVQESYYTTQMLEEVPVGIALLYAGDFHIISANRCFRTLFAHTSLESKQAGYSSDKKHDPLNFFSAPDFPSALELFRSVTQTGQPFQSQEFPALHPERGITYWSGSVTPVYNAHGQLEQLLLTASDVTEQVRARQQAASQLSKSETDTENLRILAKEAIAKRLSKELGRENIARVAVEALMETLKPLCACIHLVQPSAQELRLAHMAIDERDPAAESLRQMADDLRIIPYDSPHWIARARHEREPILLHGLHDIPGSDGAHSEQMLTQGTICMPLWFKEEQLEGTLVLLFRKPLTAYDTLVHILEECCTCVPAALAHSRLLDEVEREQRRLRAVLDHSPEGIFLAEADTKSIIYANEAAARILNYPREYLFNISLERVYRLERKPFSLTHQGQEVNPPNVPLLRALAGGTVVGEEIQFTRPDRAMVTLLVAAAPIWNEAGVITGAVTIFQDITRRKSIEQQKNEFLSIASHELRTPTTAIQGYAEILQLFAEQNFQPSSTQALQITASILEQSMRLTRLIDEMLDISTIEHRQIVMHTAPHDLAATVRRAIEYMTVTDHQHQLTLTLQGIAPGEALPGVFDEERILQVLSNFISNAIKYSQPGSVIEIGLQYDQARPEHARLWVRDTGIGIPSGDLPHIFERFHRAENFDRSISGLGIGLYLAHEIVLRHGGSIWVDSQESQGSTFSVELPLHPPAPPANPTAMAQPGGK